MVHSRPTLFTVFSILVLLAAASLAVGETVLLDFSSPYCGPCRQMEPIVRQLKSQGYPIREVDVTREPQMATEHRVSAVPAFVLLVDGREVDRIVGRTGMAELQGMFRKIAPVRGGSQAVSSTVQPTAPASSAPASSGGSLAQQLIDSTVRLCVVDSLGKSYGTGTIIQSRPGEAVVLTCGHLFRETGGKGPISVDLFRASPAGPQLAATIDGEVLSYDLDSDVGLVRIRPNVAVRAVAVAPEGIALQSGDPVVSIGCNHGQNPSAWDSRVTTIDRYSGPSNVEATGSPVEGRSGGGLFNAQGQLIGVCFAADERGNEGLYSGLTSIHQELRRAGIGLGTAPVTLASAEVQSVATPPVALNQAILQAPSPLQSAERAALQELARRSAGAEVTFIIRPNQPGSRSQIITLDSASPEFVAQLVSAARTATEPRRLTTREVKSSLQGSTSSSNMPKQTHRAQQDKTNYNGWSSVR